MVFYHVLNRSIAPHAYLAVDFFFLLSGFVLAFAYQRRLDEGWPTTAFLKVRFIRLYPLYLFGLALGIVATLVELHLRPARPFFIECIFGLFVLPFPRVLAASIVAFPLNVPTWSLFSESVINIVHALLLRRRGLRFLALAVSGFAAILIGITLFFGTMDFGWDQARVLPGLCRVFFSYTAGILLFHLWKVRPSRVSIPPVLSCLLLFALLCIHPPAGLDHLWDPGVTIVLFPMLLLGSASAKVPGALVIPAELLGRLSYPIYVLHYRAFVLYAPLFKHLTHHRFDNDTAWPAITFVCLLIPASWLIERAYDLPLRALLRRKLSAA